jgi:D-alanyl-D-alanine carboxypeptidase/D-alanyl-D-alanine-endopeptidase (penicillin-binding protein 4)
MRHEVVLKTLVKHMVTSISAIFAAAGAYASMPAQLSQAAQRAGLSESMIGIWISPAGTDRPALAVNQGKPFVPASTAKVLTTMAGLDLLTPAFRWKTLIRAEGAPDARGRVRAVSITGDGDPHRVSESLWLMAERLRGLGVREIVGNITLDRSAFAVEAIDQGAFDGEANESYNVGADALLTNMKSLSLTFHPDSPAGIARITSFPGLRGIQVQRTVPLDRKSRCEGDEWQERLHGDFSGGQVTFRGRYPLACGTKSWHYAGYSADEFFTRSLGYVLNQSGIVWKGRGIEGKADPDAFLLLTEDSKPLTTIVDLINKYSNNPMARQLFLTLSFMDERGWAEPASIARSQKVIKRWLSGCGVAPGEIVLENGSGLSRSARVTPQAMGRVLNYAFRSPYAAEFIGSLPIAGLDGTMRKRGVATGSAHMKTGYIRNVWAEAGYLTDVAGRRWSVVVIVNHSGEGRRPRAKGFIDAVNRWVAEGALP